MNTLNQENMTTQPHTPGTVVHHPEHPEYGYGIVYTDGPFGLSVMHRDGDGKFSASDPDGWTPALVCGPGEVPIKVDDLDLDRWAHEDEREWPDSFDRRAIRAAKAKVAYLKQEIIDEPTNTGAIVEVVSSEKCEAKFLRTNVTAPRHWVHSKTGFLWSWRGILDLGSPTVLFEGIEN